MIDRALGVHQAHSCGGGTCSGQRPATAYAFWSLEHTLPPSQACAAMGLATPLLYLCSGVLLNMLSQVCLDMGGLHTRAARPCRLPAAPLLVLMLLVLLFKLLTSPTSSRPGQVITDTKFSAPEAHIIPAVKFTFTLVGAALRRPPRGVATPSQRRLMALIGLLDACAYTVYCLGWYRRPSRCCCCCA